MTERAYLPGAIPYSQEVIRRYTENGAWSDLTFGDLLDRAATQHPDKLALISDEIRLTYSELVDKVDRFAIALLELGVKKHDRIVIQLPNRHEFVVAFYAMQRIGAVPILSVPRHGYQEISSFVNLTAPIGWIVPSREDKREFLSLVDRVSSEFKCLKYIIIVTDGDPLPSNAVSMAELIEEVRLEDYAANYLNRFRPDPNDIAVLIPTGGTTGLPKMVPRTHNSLIVGTDFGFRHMTSDEVIIQVTPGGHMMGMATMNLAVFLGAYLVLQKILRPAEILETIEKEKVTYFLGVPTQLEGMVNHPNLEQYDVSSLKIIGTAGAPLGREVVQRTVEYFGRFGCKLQGSSYGASEGIAVMTDLDDPLDIKLGTVGRPFTPGADYKVIDETGQQLPPNTEGELVCKGPETFTGYYKSSPEEQREVFTPDGYFKSGDLARIDERGYITVTGRRKDVILRGGETLIPGKIEDLINEHPSVDKVAVIGMPDERLGERICAYVVLKPDKLLTFNELVEFLKSIGASVLLLPERLEIRDDLPLTAIGKIDKKALRKDIEETLRKEGIRDSSTVT
ncbi:MAG: AMP-binding protein [Dehalococcoidia bacterium]